jgi:MFS transporter, MFS domain-containing protein family, molybdate-anion transporter
LFVCLPLSLCLSVSLTLTLSLSLCLSPVFMWVPSMLQLMPAGASLPTGLVFACFMLSMTLGGMIFALVLPVFPGGCLSLTALVFAISAAAMAVPVYCFDFWWVFTSFLVLECMLGMFGSCGGTLRSIYYPEGMQSSIMSIFRLPLNLLVVVGTLLTDNASNVMELQEVYVVVAGMHLTALVFQVCVVFFPIPCEGQATATCGSPRSSRKKKD